MKKSIVKTGKQTRLNKAARLAVLATLDAEGWLQDRTLQEIADALGMGNHRSTILRDLRELPAVEKAIERVTKRLSTTGTSYVTE